MGGKQSAHERDKGRRRRRKSSSLTVVKNYKNTNDRESIEIVSILKRKYGDASTRYDSTSRIGSNRTSASRGNVTIISDPESKSSSVIPLSDDSAGGTDDSRNTEVNWPKKKIPLHQRHSFRWKRTQPLDLKDIEFQSPAKGRGSPEGKQKRRRKFLWCAALCGFLILFTTGLIVFSVLFIIQKSEESASEDSSKPGEAPPHSPAVFSVTGDSTSSSTKRIRMRDEPLVADEYDEDYSLDEHVLLISTTPPFKLNDTVTPTETNISAATTTQTAKLSRRANEGRNHEFDELTNEDRTDEFNDGSKQSRSGKKLDIIETPPPVLLLKPEKEIITIKTPAIGVFWFRRRV